MLSSCRSGDLISRRYLATPQRETLTPSGTSKTISILNVSSTVSYKAREAKLHLCFFYLPYFSAQCEFLQLCARVHFSLHRISRRHAPGQCWTQTEGGGIHFQTLGMANQHQGKKIDTSQFLLRCSYCYENILIEHHIGKKNIYLVRFAS